jgi:hypothetical protein
LKSVKPSLCVVPLAMMYKDFKGCMWLLYNSQNIAVEWLAPIVYGIFWAHWLAVIPSAFPHEKPWENILK